MGIQKFFPLRENTKIYISSFRPAKPVNSEYSDENKSLYRWNVFPLDSCPRDQHFHLLYEGQVAGALGSAPDQLSHHGNGRVEA